MIRRILVTTDGSEASSLGVRYAVALAKKHQASILAVHVVDIKLLEGPFLRDLSASLGTAPYVNYQGSIAMLLDERGKAALAHAASLCEARGIPCETVLQTGVIPRVIVEQAHLADLIVMGRGGEHNQFLDGLIGSTTEAVVRRAPTPVLVTGCETPEADLIMLAYDGSVHAKKALRFAATLSEHENRPLRVLVVGGNQAQEWLEETREYLGNHPTAVDFDSKDGDPGEEITRHASETGAGLIIMGAYGRSKLRELVLGSTTSYTINHAKCPVLLVR